MADINVKNVALYKSFVETVRIAVEEYLSQTKLDSYLVAECVVDSILVVWKVSELEANE